jgi:hypothetical protein
MLVILILIALAAGLLVGRLFESAHDAHQRYNSYRIRASESLSAWFKSAVISSISVLAVIFALYLLFFHGHVR